VRKLCCPGFEVTTEWRAHGDALRPWLTLLGCLLALGGSAGCRKLEPRGIPIGNYRVAPELVREAEPMIERGETRPVIDSVGWLFGIPGRLLLWDHRIDNHQISPETEAWLTTYAIENDLQHIKFRLNQYAPLEDFRRLRRNRTVGWGYRYTLGTLSVLGEAVLPGRLLGGDHYNPYTATVHLYSDVPAIALHEAAHAKDFSRRRYPGTYALAYAVPGLPLWHERIATEEVLDYVQRRADPEIEAEAYRILYPAYGTYVGGALGQALPTYSTPLYLGSVLAGHAAAHRHNYSTASVKARQRAGMHPASRP
jgi:hypothetical protein